MVTLGASSLGWGLAGTGGQLKFYEQGRAVGVSPEGTQHCLAGQLPHYMFHPQVEVERAVQN